MDKILSIRNRGEKIRGLYIGKNKGQPRIIKFGYSDCLQDRIRDSAYQTGFFHEWDFTFYIPDDQSRDSRIDEQTILKYIKDELKLTSGYGVETFQYFKPLLYSNIVKSISNKLNRDCGVHTKIKESEANFKGYKVVDYKNMRWEGPFDTDIGMKCGMCEKNNITKKFFILTHPDRKDILMNVGKDCLKKLKETYKIKHNNKRVQLDIDFFGDDIPIDSTNNDQTITNTTILDTYMDEFVYKTPSINYCKNIISTPDTSNYTSVRYAMSVLLFDRFIKKCSKGNDRVSISVIVKELNDECKTSIFDEYLIKSLATGIFAIEENTLVGSYFNNMYLATITFLDTALNNNVKLSYNPQTDDKDKLNKKQFNAIDNFRNNKLLFLTGRGGTGKTKVSTNIIKSINSDKNMVYILAPYNTILQRQKDALHLDVYDDKSNIIFKTVSSFLIGLKTKKIKINRPSLIVIDEFPLVDIVSIYKLCTGLESVKHLIKFLFLGDPNQLPSINLSYWFGQYIEYFRANKIFSVLTEQMRNKDETQNIFSSKFLSFDENLNAVVSGVYDEKSFNTLCSDSKIELDMYNSNRIIELYIQGYQYITYTNDIRKMINETIHKYITDDMCPECTKEFICDSLKFCRMCVDKHKYIVTESIITDDSTIHKSSIINGRDIVYKDDKLVISGVDITLTPEMFTHHLSLSYCLTINKSQGSEYPKVCYIINSYHLSNSIHYQKIYTAVTRHGKTLKILYYQNNKLLHKSSSIGETKLLHKSSSREKTKMPKGTYEGKTYEWVYENFPYYATMAKPPEWMNDYIDWKLTKIN
ncbi:MAG: AAA family ATPase [Candidatus Colwellbacteria bacterium]|nr:AAA family ATPase [Candidatus Colwellbacteria bacterium]